MDHKELIGKTLRDVVNTLDKPGCLFYRVSYNNSIYSINDVLISEKALSMTIKDVDVFEDHWNTDITLII